MLLYTFHAMGLAVKVLHKGNIQRAVRTGFAQGVHQVTVEHCAKLRHYFCMLALSRSISVFILSALLSTVHADSASDARAILEKWIKTSQSVTSIQSEFDQVRYLKNVARPLLKQGKIWMEKPDRFRWQVGDPPLMLAVHGKDGSFIFMDTREKKARVWSKQALLEQEQQGKEQGLAMMSGSFNANMADFDKRFEIQSAAQVPDQPDVWKVEMTLRDRQAAVFVKGLSFTVSTGDGTLRSFAIHMRDGSRFETIVRSYSINKAVDASVFKLDTAGYVLEDMGKK